MAGIASKSSNISNNSINNANFVKKTYLAVIDDVVTNIREMLLEDGYDEQLIHELKTMWQAKLQASNAVQPPSEEEQQAASTSAAAAAKETPPPASKTTSAAKNANTSASVASVSAAAAATPILSPFSLPSLAPSPLASPAPTPSQPGRKRPAGHIAVKSEKYELDEVDLAALDEVKSLPSVKRELDFGASPMTSGGLLSPGLFSPLAPPSVEPPVVTRKPLPPPPPLQPSSSGKRPHQHQGFPPQLDGAGAAGSSDEDDDDDDIIDDDDDEDADDKLNGADFANEEEGREGSPLNSEDDLTNDSEKSESNLFDTDHVIVCQYDKITRNKNKWKFHLKDGIMSINGKDYLFNKLTGEAIF